MAKIRLKAKCRECGETYSKLIDTEDTEGVVKLVCPYCGYESKVEFVDNSIKYVLKGETKVFGLDDVIRFPKGIETYSKEFHNIQKEKTMKTNFMVFIAGDNNLDRAGQTDIKEMLAVEETGDKLNIIVQFDQSAGNSESSTTKRYVIQDCKKVVDIDIGETNCGDVDTLSDFLSWGMDSYPADRNIVILWNHGGGSSDDLPQYYNNVNVLDRSIDRVRVSKDSGTIRAVSPNPALGDEPSLFPQALRLKRLHGYIEEYQEQKGESVKMFKDGLEKSILLDDESRDFIDNLELKDIFSQYDKKIDIIGFDACLMNMMEVAYQLRDHTEMIVGSEENEPTEGWDYQAILSYIVDNPEASNAAISNNIINSYIDSYKQLNGRRKLSLSSIRTDALEDVVALMNNFAYSILQNEANIFKTLRNIVDDVEYFNDDDLYFDLYHFVSLTKDYYTEDESYQEDIQEAADELLEGIKALIVDNKTVKLDNAHGVSVYLGTNAKMSPLALNIFSKLDINSEAPYWFELFKKMSKKLGKGIWEGV